MDVENSSEHSDDRGRADRPKTPPIVGSEAVDGGSGSESSPVREKQTTPRAVTACVRKKKRSQTGDIASPFPPKIPRQSRDSDREYHAPPFGYWGAPYPGQHGSDLESRPNFGAYPPPFYPPYQFGQWGMPPRWPSPPPSVQSDHFSRSGGNLPSRLAHVADRDDVDSDSSDSTARSTSSCKLSIHAPDKDSLYGDINRSKSVCSESKGSKPTPPSRLFVALPGEKKSEPTVGGTTQLSLPAACQQQVLVSSLYKSKPNKAVAKPTSKDLASSSLFNAFGEVAVIQGVEDEGIPKLCLDPAQRASLQNSMCSGAPGKLKAQPKYRVQKYPLHDSTEDILSTPSVDPVFLKKKDLKKKGLDSGSNLAISAGGESLDSHLALVQKALITGTSALIALQQGLGRAVSEIQTPLDTFDPAVAKATLTEAFAASQDALDQVGRAFAL